MSRFPFPIPNGWFQVAYADELGEGEVRPLRYFGRDLVLFRTVEGEPALLDAHCPHLGAHLGIGGVVEGDAVRCPFHAWRFGTDGRCRGVPYASRIPPRAEARSYPIRERNGMLWGYHHAAGEAPTWEVPEIPEATSPDYTPFERHRFRIRTQPQEIGENGVDRAHFRYVHGTKEVPDAELFIDGHVRRAIQHVTLATPRGEVKGTIAVEAHGMGCSITRFSGICETVLVISHTPIDAAHVDTRFSFTQRQKEGAPERPGVAAAIIRDIVKQMHEDIPIWENKRYLDAPKLCDGDGPIGAYRAWTRQFYGTIGERPARPGA